jgi:hypothetical protein
VPEAEFDSMGCNVLAIAPRRCVMLRPIPDPRGAGGGGRRVIEIDGEEISSKAGGPTCLTRPLLRLAQNPLTPFDGRVGTPRSGQRGGRSQAAPAVERPPHPGPLPPSGGEGARRKGGGGMVHSGFGSLNLRSTLPVMRLTLLS